jgi:hypothetical protein
METIISIAGWVGAALILVAYALLSTGKLRAGSPVYQGLNLVGAAGFVINSGWHGAVPSAALNVVWMGLSCYALWRPPA